MFNITYENKENILFATLKGELMAQEVKKLKEDFESLKKFHQKIIKYQKESRFIE